MNKQSYLSVDRDGGFLSNFGRGTAMGFATLASLYGLNELRRHLANKLIPSEKIFNSDDPLYINIKEASSNKVFDYFHYGMGIPVGLYLGLRGYNYLDDVSDREQLKAKIKKYELTSKDMLKDASISSFLDGYIDGLEKKANWFTDIAYGIPDTISTTFGIASEAPHIFTGILPAFSGALFTGGLIGGYHGLENYMDPDASFVGYKDIIGKPKVLYREDPKKKKN